MSPIGNPNNEESLLLFVSKDVRISKRQIIQNQQARGRRHLRFFFQLAVATVMAGVGIRILTAAKNTIDTEPAAHVDLEEATKPVASGSSKVFYDTDPIYPPCHVPPCFKPAKIRVAPSSGNEAAAADYFPSFWNFAHSGAIDVSYDKRAIKLNGKRVLFLGGSLHPSRATPKTWNLALDEAVQNGLNLITIYVMWGAHQPVPGKEIDWSFPDSAGVECRSSSTHGNHSKEDGTSTLENNSCNWTLASAIREAANRGLFVHLRVGPYDCAEYNYGGIPEWVPLHKPNMAMRRPNRDWLDAMEDFVTKMIAYIDESLLWAHQGGNIVIAQIENELGGEIDVEKEKILLVDTTTGEFVDREDKDKVPLDHILRNATLQDYADWSGELAGKLAPNVTWTMCNGLSANNTIHTSNCLNGDGWLENYGDTGRIQIDQPALLTEFEGGFQTWGEDPMSPDDYFWGRTARDMARDALRWFARGGTHLNYYMFWGGYNRARSAGAGVANWYASDVPLCPSGQRKQPKFGHFEAMHSVLKAISPTLLTCESALKKDRPIPFLNPEGVWETGDMQRIFEYTTDSEGFQHVTFVENDADQQVDVQVPLHGDGSTKIIKMKPHSSVVMIDGLIAFDSAAIDPRTMSFQRKFADKTLVPQLLDWSSWQEPIGVDSGDAMTWSEGHPIEQTELNVYSRVYSDYAWYETTFTVESIGEAHTLFIETQEANAFVAFVNKRFIGANDRHFKAEGPFTLSIDLGTFNEVGEYKLSLLSESLGYNNLIGRWGGSTDAKTKGITGDIILSTASSGNTSLVDGRIWRSFPGLHGEKFSRSGSVRRAKLQKHLQPCGSSSPSWSSALFDTPRYDPSYQALFLKVTSGRGHLWLNGRDLGRYWNITRHESSVYSQEFYLLPDDYFYTDGSLNEIVLFDAVGDASSSAELVLSWIESTDEPNFQDEVDYPLACI